MTKIKLLATVFLFFTAFTFVSCEVESIDPALAVNNGGNTGGGNTGGGNTGGGTSGAFKADFDGQTFTASTTQAIVNDDYIAITGMKSTGEFFQITVPEGTVGTYTWDDYDENSGGVQGGFALIYSQASGSIPYMGASDQWGAFADVPGYTDTAEIIITSIDTQNKKISGKFKFTGIRYANGVTIETKVFTNGSFTNIPYTADVPTNPSNNNTFFAKLNGQNFTPTNISAMSMSDRINIIGRKGAVENIALSLKSNVTPGTYNLTMIGDYSGRYTKDMSPLGNFASDSGSVTVISHDVANKKIKGTFHFVATLPVLSPDTHNVTDGTFDVTYQ